jgi:hypothetical protein
MKSLFLVSLVLVSASLCAQEIGSAGKAPSASPRTHYASGFAKTPRTWKLGNNTQSSDQVSQMVLDALTAQLTTKGLTRVPTISEQCCNLQIEVLSAASSQASGASAQITVFARMTVTDVDQQTVFTNKYQGEGSVIKAAAADLAAKAVADPQLLRALTGGS